MGPITATELQSVCSSLRPLITGSAVEKIIEPAPDALELITRGENLFISLHPSLCHLGAPKTTKSRGASSAFCMLLRKHLTNTIITAISPERERDRIFTITFSRGDRLVGELTSRHANLFLCDAQGVILGAHHSSASSTRALHAGARYEPPPFVPHEEPPPRFTTAAGASDHFMPLLTAARRAALRHHLEKQLRATRKRSQRVLGALTKDRRKCEAMIAQKRLGELLLILQYSWPRGTNALMVDPAPDGGPPVQITLPGHSTDPVRGATHFFERYKKGKRGLEHIAQREAKIRDDLAKIEAQIAHLSACSIEELVDLERAIERPARVAVPTSKKNPSQGSKQKHFRQFATEDGTVLLVGRGARENHLLTFRVAKGNEHWFHARDYPGAHVIIQGTSAPTAEQIRDAAALALYFSDARKEERGDVIHTQRKYLRPVKGAPGRVTHSKSSNVFIELTPERMARLLATKSS